MVCSKYSNSSLQSSAKQHGSILCSTASKPSSRLPNHFLSSNSKWKPVDPATAPTTTTTASIVPVPRSPPISELKSQKPKTRRGKRNSKKSCNNICSSINSDSTWQIYQSNIRGYNSKKESLKYMLSAINPNAVILNEVSLRGNKRCSIQGYNTFTRNRKNLNMGGISTSIREDENQFCLKVD